MADDRFSLSMTGHDTEIDGQKLASLIRKFLELTPWLVASIVTHVAALTALALIQVGGQAPPQGIDMTTWLELTPTPSPTPPREVLLYGEILGDSERMIESGNTQEEEMGKPDFEDISEDQQGDSEAPSDQPLSDDTIGAFGLGGGSPTGAYGNRRGGSARHGAGYSEKCVDMGTKWLADHQEYDGHWDTRKWGGNGEYDPGVCGLALLSFAGAGHTERSGRYSRVVRKAIAWLASQQDAKGNLAPRTTMYSHAISTLALLEEVAIAPVPSTQDIAKKALDYMISVQNESKAWRYWPKDNDNDVSVTAWCVMAMKAASVAGFDVPAKSWDGVRNFLDEVTEPDSGEVGYTRRPVKGSDEPAYKRYSITACGLLCRLYMGMPRDEKLIQKGALILMENLPEWNQPGIGAQFYYYWFYGSLVLFQIEGDCWKKWNLRMRDMLVAHQNVTPGELKGSWDPSPSTHFSQMGGRVYSTAMAVLTLEVYYRYEIFSRSGTAEKK
ncbi:MAG: prenyltransferase/squalene oxidase repeat-containing protein [Candidatus Brocadiia bacterium]